MAPDHSECIAVVVSRPARVSSAPNTEEDIPAALVPSAASCALEKLLLSPGR